VGRVIPGRRDERPPDGRGALRRPRIGGGDSGSELRPSTRLEGAPAGTSAGFHVLITGSGAGPRHPEGGRARIHDVRPLDPACSLRVRPAQHGRVAELRLQADAELGGEARDNVPTHAAQEHPALRHTLGNGGRGRLDGAGRPGGQSALANPWAERRHHSAANAHRLTPRNCTRRARRTWWRRSMATWTTTSTLRLRGVLLLAGRQITTDASDPGTIVSIGLAERARALKRKSVPGSRQPLEGSVAIAASTRRRTPTRLLAWGPCGIGPVVIRRVWPRRAFVSPSGP